MDSDCIIAAVQTGRSYGIVLLIFQVSVPLHAAFTILYIAACYADIQNNACVCVRALVVQIMKSFRLARAVHVSSLRIAGISYFLYGFFRQYSLIQLVPIRFGAAGYFNRNIITGIRVGLDMRGVHHDALPLDQSCLLAPCNDLVKDLPEYLVSFEPTATILRKRGVIWGDIVQVKSQIPTIGDIISHFLCQLAFRINSVQIAKQQHFHKNHRINGWPALCAVQRRNDVVHKVKTNRCV